MANSYIIHGTNVTCTNMQITGPNHVEVLRSTPNIVHSGKSKHYLTVIDKQVELSFKCKMAAKKWGGLAMLCAGIAIVGAIALVVATGGAAAPFLLAAAVATTSQVAVTIAVVGVAASLVVGAIKEHEDCKALWESPDWEFGHEQVLFQGQMALLNSSKMVCIQGGTLELIISDAIALEAAKLISSNNTKEILIQAGSQFVNGIVTGLTGGGNIPGVIMTIGFYVKFEDSTSNKQPNFGDDMTDFAKEESSGIAEGATTGTIQHGVSKAQVWMWRNITFSRILNGASEESINSAANMWGMAANAPKTIWKDFAKSSGLGLGGAVIGFGIDQGANKWERSYETMSDIKSNEFNLSDNGNNIGVISIDK